MAFLECRLKNSSVICLFCLPQDYKSFFFFSILCCGGVFCYKKAFLFHSSDLQARLWVGEGISSI